MEISKRTKIAIIAAIIWALVAFSFVVFAFNSGKNPYGPISIIHHGGLIFYLLLCGILVRSFFNELSFGFKDALTYSVIIGVLGNSIFMSVGFIYLNTTWDTSFPIYINNMTVFFTALSESGELDKFGEVDYTELENKIGELKNATAWNIVFNDFGGKMLISLITSFIIAIVMRKSK